MECAAGMKHSFCFRVLGDLYHGAVGEQNPTQEEEELYVCSFITGGGDMYELSGTYLHCSCSLIIYQQVNLTPVVQARTYVRLGRGEVGQVFTGWNTG